MAKKNKINGEKDLEYYYKTAVISGEEYAKNIEPELAKQGKKLLLKTMRDCLEKNQSLKTL